MNLEHRQIPIPLRVAITLFCLLMAALAAISGIRASSVMAWIAFVLFLALGIGMASGKIPIPSNSGKSSYWPSFLVLLVGIGYLSWLIVGKLVA